MNTGRIGNSSVIGGMVIILLGAAFLGSTFHPFSLGWGNLWPVFMTIVGVGLVTLAFTLRKQYRAGVVMSGATLVLLSAFLFAFTLGLASWSEQATLWPLYLMIPGLGALAAYLGSDMEQPGYLMAGAAICGVASVLLVGTVTGAWGPLL